MKCDKCNNEATFHYQANINGDKSEYHLCASCAKEEGFDDMMSFRPHSMMGDFFNEPFTGLANSCLGGKFGNLEKLADSFFGSTQIMPKDETNIRIENPHESRKKSPLENMTKEAKKKKDNIPEKACDELMTRRQISALRHKMKAAVITENFEEAAKLRDEIKSLQA